MLGEHMQMLPAPSSTGNIGRLSSDDNSQARRYHQMHQRMTALSSLQAPSIKSLYTNCSRLTYMCANLEPPAKEQGT
jgi:hypothetical protein